MAQLQKTLVLLVGDDVQPLHKRLEEAMNHRRLADGGVFPPQLLEILTLSNEELGSDVSTWSLALERGLNRVNDALTILQLSKERGLAVAQPLTLYLVVPCCDEVGSARMVDVLELVHRICRANKFLFQLEAFLLLPGLFEDRQDINPQLLRARALTTFCRLNYLMKHCAEPPWEDNVPLNNIWLIDSRNARGEFIGYLDQALDMIAEMVAACASGDLEGVHEVGNLAEDGRYYSSFGYSQVRLPLTDLQQQMINRFVTYVLDQILHHERIDSNEVLLAVKQLCHDERLTPTGILKSIANKPDGSSFFMPFVPDVDAALPASAYVEALIQQAQSYENGLALQGKRALHHRADEVFRELAVLIDTKLAKLVDTHPGGSFYAQAYLEELLGEGEKSELTQGPRLDVPTNLLTRRRELMEQLFQDLGIPEYRKSLREIERSLANIQVELELLGAQLHEVENTTNKKKSKTRETTVKTLYQRVSALENERQHLHGRKTEIGGLLSLVDPAITDLDARNALREHVEQERRSRIAAIAESLRQAGQELLTARQTLSNLAEERPYLLRRYFIHYLIALGGGILIALLALIFTGRVPFPGVLFNTLTWQVALLLIATYFVWALWRFHQRILVQIRQTQRQIAELERRIEKHKLDLRDSYHQLYQILYTQHRDNVALSGIQAALIDPLREKLLHSKTFLKKLRDWQQQVSEQSLQSKDSLTNVSLLKPEHYEVLFQWFIGEDLPREVARCRDPNFGGQSLSQLIWSHNFGAETLIQALQRWGKDLVRRKLEGFGIEELLWGKPFEELRRRMSLIPKGILDLLQRIEPSVQLHDTVGTSIAIHRATGVPDIRNSWLREFLDSTCKTFSHGDSSRLTAFCVTSRFPLNALSQLDYYRDALRAVWPWHKDKLRLSKLPVEQVLAECGIESLMNEARSQPVVKRGREVRS